MRREDRQITYAEALSILQKGDYGVLSTVSLDNEPYGVPVNYCLVDKCIYIHSALEGKKIDNIIKNPKVSFCVVGNAQVLPEEFSTKYESCIVQGSASESFNEEKQLALEALLKKYSKEFISEGLAYIKKLKDETRVFKITIKSFSGKARR